MRSTLAGLSLLLLAAPSHAAYSLKKSYSGSTFFDSWTYYGNYDNLTNGDVVFVNQSVGASAQLTYINSAGNAIIKVDNTSTVPYNEKRNTVRLQSVDSYSIGSLWVMDAIHVPYGCSVWPAFWSQAAIWPAGGEIDTFEGVNLQAVNQMALHTTTGCEAVGTLAAETGTLTYANCSSSVTGNPGCTVTEANTASYGAAFAAAGGGVWATQLSDAGISIWFFSRANVPGDLLTSNTSAIPDPTTWGTPSAFYANSGCAIDKFFQAQHLVLDITLCGDWAGAPAVFNETCTGVCYTDYVMGNGTNYATAYFEIPSIRVYTGPNTTTTTTSTGAGAIVSSTNSFALLVAATGILVGVLTL